VSVREELEDQAAACLLAVHAAIARWAGDDPSQEIDLARPYLDGWVAWSCREGLVGYGRSRWRWRARSLARVMLARLRRERDRRKEDAHG
jgi:hypothetical protein